MNILLLGSGGREHAIAKKILESKRCSKLFVAPGNAGTGKIATNVNIKSDDFEGLKKFSLENDVKMVVVGPEDPLVKGVYDFFKKDEKLRDVIVIGASKEGAKLEGSKEYAKEFMDRHGIPTARYKSFTGENIEEGYRFLESLKAPYVLKADGLAAGKGVLIIKDILEAKEELKNMLLGSKFGEASQKVVIEEFLDGIELSCFVLTDGKDYKILPMAKDYKRVGEGDTGLNTGGMGAISPVPFADEEFVSKIKERIVVPTIEGIKKDGIEYKGFVFVGLIKVGNAPYVIEYNIRMGDPETEVVFPRIESDVVEIFEAMGKGELGSKELKISKLHSGSVMLVSGGYPEEYEKGKEIKGIENVGESIVFHAGTQEKEGKILTNGGRVIAVTSLGENIKEALEKSYKNIEKISFEGMYFRKDIGYEF